MPGTVVSLSSAHLSPGLEPDYSTYLSFSFLKYFYFSFSLSVLKHPEIFPNSISHSMAKKIVVLGASFAGLQVTHRYRNPLKDSGRTDS